MITLLNEAGHCLGIFSSKAKAQKEINNLTENDKEQVILFQVWEIDNIEPDFWGIAFLPEGKNETEIEYKSPYLGVHGSFDEVD